MMPNISQSFISGTMDPQNQSFGQRLKNQMMQPQQQSYPIGQSFLQNLTSAAAGGGGALGGAAKVLGFLHL